MSTQFDQNEIKNLIIDINDTGTISWNDMLETQAKMIGEECQGYKVMHVYSAKKNARYHVLLTIAGMLLGPISGTLIGIQEYLDPDPDTGLLAIIASIFAYVAGFVVAILKFGKFDETSFQNKQASSKFTSLESNIRRQLSLYRNDRICADKYLLWIETKFDEVFISSPLIPMDITEKYEKEAEKKGMVVPGKYKDVIYINKEIVMLDDIHEGEVEDIKINSVNSKDKTKIDGSNKQKSLVPNGKKINMFAELQTCSDAMLEYEMNRMNK